MQFDKHIFYVKDLMVCWMNGLFIIIREENKLENGVYRQECEGSGNTCNEFR